MYDADTYVAHNWRLSGIFKSRCLFTQFEGFCPMSTVEATRYAVLSDNYVHNFLYITLLLTANGPTRYVVITLTCLHDWKGECSLVLESNVYSWFFHVMELLAAAVLSTRLLLRENPLFLPQNVTSQRNKGILHAWLCCWEKKIFYLPLRSSLRWAHQLLTAAYLQWKYENQSCGPTPGKSEIKGIYQNVQLLFLIFN